MAARTGQQTLSQIMDMIGDTESDTSIEVLTSSSDAPPGPKRVRYMMGTSSGVESVQKDDAQNRPNGIGDGHPRFRVQKKTNYRKPVGKNVTICGCLGTFIGIILTLTLCIAPIVIGSIYFRDCPGEPHLTLALISFGSILTGIILVVMILLLIQEMCREFINEEFAVFLFAIVIFTFGGLHIYICFIVYTLYGHVNYTDVTLIQDYCHKTVFLFTFWMLNSIFIIIAVAALRLLCYVIVKPDSDNRRRRVHPRNIRK